MHWKFEKEFREAHPETIGESDKLYDYSNYVDWLEQELVNKNDLLQRVSGSSFTEHEIQLIHFALLNYPKDKLSERTNGYKQMQQLADKVIRIL